MNDELSRNSLAQVHSQNGPSLPVGQQLRRPVQHQVFPAFPVLRADGLYVHDGNGERSSTPTHVYVHVACACYAFMHPERGPVLRALPCSVLHANLTSPLNKTRAGGVVHVAVLPRRRAVRGGESARVVLRRRGRRLHHGPHLRVLRGLHRFRPVRGHRGRDHRYSHSLMLLKCAARVEQSSSSASLLSADSA